MNDYKNQVVLLNDDASSPDLCFVCGTCLKGVGYKIVDITTSFMQIPLANKLGDFVGNDFCIILSKFDEICKRCLHLIDQVDAVEQNLVSLKSKVINLLQKNYSIKVEANHGDLIIEDNGDPLSEFTCESETKFPLENSIKEEMFDDQSNEFVKVESIYCSLCSVRCDGVEQYRDHVNKWHNREDEYVLPDKPCEENQQSIFNLIDSGEEVVSTIDDLKEDSPSVFVCGYCSSTFPSESELNDHVDEMHPSSSEKIILNENSPSVVKIFCEVSSLDEPPDISIAEHDTSSDKCDMSEHSDEDQTASQSGVSQFMGKKVFICKICSVPFVSLYALNKHKQVHEKSGGPIDCHICGKKCQDSLHAFYHRRNEHYISNETTCGVCNETLQTPLELKNHILVMHKGKKEFKCKECDKVFSRQSQYENHKLYAHGNSECRVCGKHIADAVKLRQHEHRHARIDMKTFECDVCHRTFKTPGGLRVHSVSHTGKYKFFCEFCGRGFMSSVILEEHKGVHTKEERYICDICGRKFVLYSTFHLHKQWHENPYPFPCRMCGRKFRYRSERSHHVRRDHTGEMPHKCPYCDAAFIKSGYLKKHITSHTKKYPFNCEICRKGFDQKRALARHLSKVHDDNTLLDAAPKKCQYKVALRPEEYPM